jgi:diguanylate cyclase (GGDEF)-like protein
MNCSGLSSSTLYAVLNSLESGIIILDQEQKVLYWNDWFSQRNGQNTESATGLKLSESLPGLANNRLEQAIEQAIKHKLPSLLSPALHGAILPLYQSTSDRKLNQRLQQLIHVIPLRNDPAAACLIQITDVTANISRERQLRQQTDKLRRTTTHDEVTGLDNRRTFDATLDQEFAKAKTSAQGLALIIGDLDQFNDINTNQSREAGDACLKEVAKIFQKAIRPNDDFAARYGGDEFALILPGYDKEGAFSLARNICQQVRELKTGNAISNMAGGLTMSLGISVLIPGIETDTDTDTLLSSVEVALYQAKSEGRNQAVYFSMDDSSFETWK